MHWHEALPQGLDLKKRPEDRQPAHTLLTHQFVRWLVQVREWDQKPSAGLANTKMATVPDGIWPGTSLIVRPTDPLHEPHADVGGTLVAALNAEQTAEYAARSRRTIQCPNRETHRSKITRCYGLTSANRHGEFDGGCGERSTVRECFEP